MNEENIPENAISVYNQGNEAMDDFPILRAFQQYVEREQEKSRRRVTTITIVFLLVIAGICGLFVYLLQISSMRNQTLSDRLVEYAMQEADRRAAHVDRTVDEEDVLHPAVALRKARALADVAHGMARRNGRAPAEDAVREDGLADRVVGRTPEPHALAGAVDRAVRDIQVLSERIVRIVVRRFDRAEDDRIVTRPEVAAEDAHPLAAVEVESVVVDHPLVGGDGYAFDLDIAAEPYEHCPAWRILECRAFKTDAVAVHELDHPWALDRRLGIEYGLRVGGVEKFGSVTVDYAFAGDCDVLRIICIDKHLAGKFRLYGAYLLREAVIGFAIVSSQQKGTFLKMQLDIAPELNGSHVIRSFRNHDLTATLAEGLVYHCLNVGGCIPFHGIDFF